MRFVFTKVPNLFLTCIICFPPSPLDFLSSNKFNSVITVIILFYFSKYILFIHKQTFIIPVNLYFYILLKGKALIQKNSRIHIQHHEFTDLWIMMMMKAVFHIVAPFPSVLLHREVSDLRAKVSTLEDAQTATSGSLSDVSERLATIKARCERQEHYSRRENVILHGLAEESGETYDTLRTRATE